MSPFPTLLASAVLAYAAPAPGPSSPPSDAALGMAARMDSIEPNVKTLTKACEALLPLFAAHASGVDPDAPGSGRALLRRDVEAAHRRLRASVSDFWHEAEALRVAKTAEFFMKSAWGGKTDGEGTAAVILQPPAFPKTAMHMHQHSLLLLHYEEEAYQAARARRRAGWEAWVGLALGGLVAGALLTYWVTSRFWAAPLPDPIIRLK